MTTAVRSAEAEDAQNPEVDAVDEDGGHQSSGIRRRGRAPRRRHHSLPRQLLRVFEAAPSRSFVQSGLALRMEPFEGAVGRMEADEVENSGGGSTERRRRLTGDQPRPLRAQGRWSSTLDLPQPDTHPRCQPQPPLFDRPLFGADIPEPLSSYERHVRRAIERHRRAGSAGQLRRYATLADLSDLEAAAAEVERRVNGWDDGSPSPEAKEEENVFFLAPPPPPPPLPPRPPPRPKASGRLQPPFLHLPARQPHLHPSSVAQGRRPPPRFSTFDSFEAIKRTITESSAVAARTTATISEPASSSRLLETHRWLLDAADARVRIGDGSGSGAARAQGRWPAPAPASASARATLPPPVPLRRNRQRQQPPLAATTSMPRPYQHPHPLHNPHPHPHPLHNPHPHPHPQAPLSASSGSTYGLGDVSGYGSGGYRHSTDGRIIVSRNGAVGGGTQGAGVFFERESVV